MTKRSTQHSLCYRKLSLGVGECSELTSEKKPLEQVEGADSAVYCLALRLERCHTNKMISVTASFTLKYGNKFSDLVFFG